MKKLLSLVLIGIICITITGCGNNDSNDGLETNKNDKVLTCTQYEDEYVWEILDEELIYVFDKNGENLKSVTYNTITTYKEDPETSYERDVEKQEIENHLTRDYETSKERCDEPEKGVTCSVTREGYAITKKSTIYINEVEDKYKNNMGEFIDPFVNSNYHEVKESLEKEEYICK